MKIIKSILLIVISINLVSSCQQDDYYNPHTEPEIEPINLELLLTDYDLWYVDYNRTTGEGDVPFVSIAFTMSFINGRVYANNNIVGIGFEGNGFGIQTGTYDSFELTLRIDHVIDGVIEFEVIQEASNKISIYDRYSNVTYYLIGYQKDTFDYDMVFYDNIEFFLQEYEGWEKTLRSDFGAENDFDYENYLAFTPDNITTFYSSEDQVGMDVKDVLWDYVGAYEVFDVDGHDNFKILTLDYDIGYNEEFELVVLNDETIELYHVNSETVYNFSGREFLQFLRPERNNKDDQDVSLEGRKRTKVKRKTIHRAKHIR